MAALKTRSEAGSARVSPGIPKIQSMPRCAWSGNRRVGWLFAISSSEEARRVADAHYRDGYPNSEFVFDGFAWLPDPDPWWSYPGRVSRLAR